MKKKSKGANLDLRDSAHKIWLAGLGALAAAEEEGGKMFRSLVDRGEAFQETFNGPVDKATDRVRGTYRDVRSKTSETLSRVEHALDDRLALALGRIGIPSRREVVELTRKVEELTRRLEGKPAGRRKTARKKAAARKTSTRKASTRKTKATGGAKKKATARKKKSSRKSASAR